MTQEDIVLEIKPFELKDIQSQSSQSINGYNQYNLLSPTIKDDNKFKIHNIEEIMPTADTFHYMAE
jgi:hypothetical protein